MMRRAGLATLVILLVAAAATTSVPAALAEPPPSFEAAGPAEAAPSITIVQDSIADGPQDFTFEGCLGAAGGGSCSDFTLDDDADASLPRQVTSQGLAPGAYAITQTPAAAWTLVDINCNGLVDPVDLANGRVTFTLDEGEAITCTFTNRSASLTIVQDATPDHDQDFAFSGCLGAGCSTFTIDDDADPTLPRSVTGSGLPAGTYSVTQSPDATWPLSALTCTTGEIIDLANRRATITLDPTEWATCTFTNETQSLTIVQDTSPDAATDFEYTGCQGSGCSPFTLDDDDDATLPEQVTGIALAPGTYTVTQGTVPGYTLTGLSCDTDEITDLPMRAATITLTPGEHATCTFTNGLTNPPVPYLTDVVAVSGGGTASCARLSSGGVDCWGFTEHTGTSGPGFVQTRARPVLQAGSPVTGVAEIDSGAQHSCGRLTSGGVRCWGSNGSGQLGRSSSIGGTFHTAQTTQISGVTELDTGGSFTCAAVSSQARCWGSDSSGALGNGAASSSGLPVTVQDPTGTGPLVQVLHISAGTAHACAVLTNQQAVCWGDNAEGQLGDGTTADHSLPVPVLNGDGTAPLDGIADIQAIGNHTCALMIGGQAECWGRNDVGDLGDGTTTDRLLPAPLLNPAGDGPLTGITQTDGRCAVLDTTQVVCWGSNSGGIIGDGTTTNRPLPVHVLNETETAPLTGVASAGGICLALTNGQARCRGSNGFGTVGNGQHNTSTGGTGSAVLLPTQVLVSPT